MKEEKDNSFNENVHGDDFEGIVYSDYWNRFESIDLTFLKFQQLAKGLLFFSSNNSATYAIKYGSINSNKNNLWKLSLYTLIPFSILNIIYLIAFYFSSNDVAVTNKLFLSIPYTILGLAVLFFIIWFHLILQSDFTRFCVKKIYKRDFDKYVFRLLNGYWLATTSWLILLSQIIGFLFYPTFLFLLPLIFNICIVALLAINYHRSIAYFFEIKLSSALMITISQLSIILLLFFLLGIFSRYWII